MQHSILYLLLFTITFYSCNVTNNLYVNDPVPVGKGEVDIELGVGTGLQTVIDSVANNGNIYFNNEYSFAPILYLGGQIGINEKLDFRFALHFPYGIGGFGLRSGLQYSLLPGNSKLKLALGSDMGFVLAKDTVKVFGSDFPTEITTNGAINADFFLPHGYAFFDNFRIILTPRYSFNGVFVRKNEHDSKAKLYKPHIFAMSFGVRYKRIYIEYSSLFYKHHTIPSFGVCYMVSSKTDSKTDEDFMGY